MKLKTNKVVDWLVVDHQGQFVDSTKTRKTARILKHFYNHEVRQGHRIAKVMVTK